MYSIEKKTTAIRLRKRGFSLTEISEKLHIAKSTSSVWLSGINLSTSAQKRLARKKMLGQYKTVLLKRAFRETQRKKLQGQAYSLLKKITFSREIAKLYCALIWWCEGNKNFSSVRFTSSDVTLIKNFLFLLRSGFSLDEAKFRAIVHIHEYHNDSAQKEFWSEITKIPLTQFWKSYQKGNTSKRVHQDYPGCIAISYYDARIAKELEAIYNAFSNRRGVVQW